MNNRSHSDSKRKGLTVEVRNGDFNFALRKFKKKIQEDGILQELRQDRQEYIKPSEKRKRAKAAGIARWKKKMRTMETGGKRDY